MANESKDAARENIISFDRQVEIFNQGWTFIFFNKYGLNLQVPNERVMKKIARPTRTRTRHGTANLHFRLYFNCIGCSCFQSGNET